MPARVAASLQLAFYGDDFTGSTDTLATLSEAGLRAMLFLRVPTAQQLHAAGELDALGIAGAARSMAPDALRAELEPVALFFATLDVALIHYKTCSTFDSAPHVGSIGVAVDVLRRSVSNPMVAIIGGQPSLGRYCVFANLFAAVGTGGPIVRIDRHPTMRAHPVTPMLEADLRVHLAAQGMPRVVNFALTNYESPAEDQNSRLEHILAERPDAVLFDVGQAAHLPVIGRLISQHARNAPLLMVGPSGAAQAMLEHWRDREPQRTSYTSDKTRSIAPAQRPVFVLAGSLSPITARQLEAASSYVRQPLDAQRVVTNDVAYCNAWIAEVATHLRAGRNVLAHTSTIAVSGETRPADPSLAAQCGELLARLLREVPLRRVGIAGGDTSSHAVRALDIWALSHVGTLAPGVAVCRARSRAAHLDGMEFMLKGGQMGPEDLFERLLLGNDGP